MDVPYQDLKAQYFAIRKEMDTSLRQVFEKAAFSDGHAIRRFEESFATYCQTRHAIGVSSGTTALWLALKACGIGSGDEVLLAPNAFAAAAEAIKMCGASPVFVDIEEHTFTMNPAALETALTPRTRALIPVHMFGQTADMRPLMQIARKYKLIVIEAAGQAQGATYQGQRAGSIGDLGCFSFSPDKNLGAFGEAGGIVTNNGELAARIRTLRNHGQSKTHQHEVVGWNGRMDAIQAVVLSVKLNYIDQWNELRRQHAHQYDNLLLTHDGLLTPKVAAYGTHVYHSYVCRLGRRDAILRELNKRGIQARAHYRTPLHLQDVYRTPASEAGSLPVAERCSSDSLSLPLFPELTPSQLLHVVGTLKQVIADLPQPEESRDPSEASPSEERPAPAYKKIAIVS